MAEYVYQHGFSETHREAMYDAERRGRKAKKALAVMTDFLIGTGKDPAELTLLDIGCSTGFLTRAYSETFARVIGIDIDKDAVDHARETHGSADVEFLCGDSMALKFEEESFDCVTCTHIYEHVPDSRRLLAEIHRVLRPGGCCYFAAGNRIKFIEAHYGLPLLSVVPKSLGHIYVRLAGKAERYYETHLSLWGLRKLVRNFEVHDYTRKVIADPVKYHATDMIRPGSLKQKLSASILAVAYWLCPTYIWILRKPDTGTTESPLVRGATLSGHRAAE